MDKHGVGEDGQNDGEECGGHGGRQPRNGRLRRQAEVRGAEAAEHPADGAEEVVGARAGGDQAEDPERQVAPPARHAAGLGLPQRDGAQETGWPTGEN